MRAHADGRFEVTQWENYALLEGLSPAMAKRQWVRGAD